MTERPKRRQAFIDRIVLFANRVLVEGWSTPPFDAAELVVTAGRVKRAQSALGIARIDRPDVSGSMSGSSLRGHDPRLGFLAVFDRDAWADLDLSPETGWRIFVDGTEVAAFQGRGEVLGHIGSMPDPDAARCVAVAAEATLLPAEVVRLAGAMFGGFEGVARLEAHIDAIVKEGLGFAIDGWIANAPRRNLVLMSGDGAACVTAGQVSHFARPDVSQHLRRNGHPVATEEHGFIAVFPYGATEARHVVIGAFEDGKLVGHFVASGEANADVAGLFSRINRVEGGGRFVAPSAASRLYRPFLHEREKERAWTVQDVKPLAVRPDLSIIVPFYKEDMFIRHLTTMQMWFSETVEWIFVCDDPSLRTSLETYLRRRAPLLRNRTRLVINRENYGYGPSNNIGATVAEGDYLLFMNSDIWVDDAGPLERAVAALDSGEFGAIGFRLLYEDGTIQHDGLAFVRHPDVHGLYLVEHPGKGLPPESVLAGDVAIAPAATGALLMVGRELYRRVGGFDDRYVRGDFEDADLCLRIAELGLPTGIVREPGIYHLERQSIRMMGEASFREAVMYLNCITFNERWGRAIDRGADVAALSRLQANTNKSPTALELQVAE